MVATETRGVVEAPEVDSIRRGYRPQLDGLRAVAVYLVLAFHAGMHRFAGGFIGVDVFFVLSGYLVTQLLLRGLQSSGSVGLRRFYARRFRRLLPAAFVALVITAALFAALASPAEVADSLDAFRAAFLYVANWFFIHQSADYFGADINASPVVHFWSLAVEEQFYLLWPLILSGLYVATRRSARQWTLIRIAVAIGGLASVAWALHLSGGDLNRAYYGTDTRAYQLLAGAFLALTPRLFSPNERQRRLLAYIAPAALAAVFVLGTSVLHFGVINRGIAITIVTAALIVAIENTERGPVARLLSARPVVYLGQISYGTYLWHWPVIVVATRIAKPDSATTTLVTILVATGIASLSYQILERPVRASAFLDRGRMQVIVAGLTLSAIGALVVMPAILDADRSGAVAVGTADRSGAAPVPAGLDWTGAERHLANSTCFDRPAAACTLVRGTKQRILLFGDSHGMPLLAAFAALAKRESLTFSAVTLQACPWQANLEWSGISDPAVKRNVAGCREHRPQYYDRIIPEFDPDIIVLVHRPFDDSTGPMSMRGPGGSRLKPGTAQYMTLLRDATADSLARLRRPGRKIMIIEPIPIAPSDPLSCLTQAKYLDECRYVANLEPTPLERYYRSLANGKDVFTLDLDKVVCPYLPICDPVVDGLIVKRDYAHLTWIFGRSLSDELLAYLRDNRILPV